MLIVDNVGWLQYRMVPTVHSHNGSACLSAIQLTVRLSQPVGLQVNWN